MPPEVVITRLLAPVGTAIENRALDPKLPDRPVTDTPFCSVVVVLPVMVANAAPRLTEAVPAATVQLPVPVQAPVQPPKVLPLSGVAVNVTLEEVGKLPVEVEQETPHEIPLGLLVMVPLPDLVTVTCRVVAVAAKNVAVTLLATLMLTVQLPVPAQAPLQPVKVLAVAGVAVRVTLAPLVKLALHVVPQLMPAGLLVTVPLPDLLTVSELPVGGGGTTAERYAATVPMV